MFVIQAPSLLISVTKRVHWEYDSTSQITFKRFSLKVRPVSTPTPISRKEVSWKWWLSIWEDNGKGKRSCRSLVICFLISFFPLEYGFWLQVLWVQERLCLAHWHLALQLDQRRCSVNTCDECYIWSLSENPMLALLQWFLYFLISYRAIELNAVTMSWVV